MITTIVLAFALTLQALSPRPALAVSFAECQAWLCLPGGFPPWECNEAHAAVLRRLAALQPALPSWSSCASAFGWDAAALGHNDRWADECPHGGTPDVQGINASTCTGQNADGCAFSYAAQKKVTVTVAVDGSTSFAPNNRLTHVVSAPGAMNIDEDSCPTGDGVPPIVGPPVSTAGPGGFN